MKYSTILIALILLSLLLFPSPIASLTCSDVVKDIRPCLAYLKSTGSKSPAACCAGAKALASAASASADKKAACNCLKCASKSMKVNLSTAKALPEKCGINLGLVLTPA